MGGYNGESNGKENGNWEYYSVGSRGNIREMSGAAFRLFVLMP